MLMEYPDKLRLLLTSAFEQLNELLVEKYFSVAKKHQIEEDEDSNPSYSHSSFDSSNSDSSSNAFNSNEDDSQSQNSD